MFSYCKFSYCKKNKCENCVICLDSKKVHLECKHCYSCKICKDCVLPLSKTDLDDQCPLCRAEDWKEPTNLSTQIIPEDIELNLTDRIKKIYEKPALKEMCKCCNKKSYVRFKRTMTLAWYSALIIFLSYMIGFLFLLLCIEGVNLDAISPYVLILVPLPLGFSIITIVGCCCCHNECRRDTKRALCDMDDIDSD